MATVRSSCDTFVVLGDATVDGGVIFGKNSDREPNEACRLVLVPAADHYLDYDAAASRSPVPASEDQHLPPLHPLPPPPIVSLVQCTHISIPQVAHTHAVLLCQPCHIWGAEMGANEHGLVIGNEATFAREPMSKEPGLIGMDLVRLALERAATADEGLAVILDLLERHGQGGNCGFNDYFTYNSAFLICDRRKAIVLETVGREWIYRQYTSGIVSISNCYSLGKEWDACSDGLREMAIRSVAEPATDKFDFAAMFSDFIYTTFARGKERSCRVRKLLDAHRGEINPLHAFAVLRDHGSDRGSYGPYQDLYKPTICMHKSAGPLRAHQTTSSMVVHLAPPSAEGDVSSSDVFWVTGTSSPCVSTFKPIIGLDAFTAEASDVCCRRYDQSSRWWRHERWYRQLALCSRQEFASFSASFRLGSDALEQRFLKSVNRILRIDEESSASRQRSTAVARQERTAFSSRCFSDADELLEESLQALKAQLTQSYGIGSRMQSLLRIHHTAAWMYANSQAGLHGEDNIVLTPHVITPHHLMALAMFITPALLARYAHSE